MLQDAPQEKPRLALPGASATAGRSSVVDRVKWIEKTHGPTPQSGLSAPPRTKLKLPKNFASADSPERANSVSKRATQINLSNERKALEESKIPKLADISTATKPLLNLRKPTAATNSTAPDSSGPQKALQQMPSPALSEKTTAAAGVDDSTAQASPPPQQPAGTTAVAASATAPIATAMAPPTTEPPPSQAVSALTSPAHSRTHSITSSASSVRGEEIEAPPVPSDQVDEAAPSFSAGTKAATVPRMFSNRLSSKPRKSLGGIRGKSPSSTRRRRYDKSQPATTPDDASEQGIETKSLSRFSSTRSRPESAVGHSRSMSQLSAGSISSGHDTGDDERPSLLARLSELSVSRPYIQDLVSNGSSPKFVKRSQFYSSTGLGPNKARENGKSWRRYK
ncbi:hypothetical protein GQ54DRAFT_195858 [Martensiomyces pterosporus]|nr:hypothetical protein GQ54DRAFT_195858 [Martensiomyces pterosporus]